MSDFQAYQDSKIANFNGQLVVIDGTGWADPDGSFKINGATEDGLDKPGPRVINAINASEVYSFHVNGAGFNFGDGSTRYMRESIDTLTFVQLATRSGGEVVAGEYLLRTGPFREEWCPTACA